MSPPFPIPVGFFGSADDGIVTAGLEVHLDAGNAASYPGTGTAWTDMITGTTFTFAATPFYNGTIGYFNFTSNNAAGTFTPAVNPLRGAVEIWFRWRDFSPISTAVLLTGGVNWSGLGNITGTLPDESIEFYNGVSAVMDDRQGHLYYKDNEWHQMVAVIDGVDNKLYVDGVPVTTTFRAGNATSTTLTNLASTIVGKYSSGYQFDGDIAIIRVYDTGAGSFSATDVAQNYAADAPRFAAFQPDNISGLTFWTDPSDASTLTLTGSNIDEIDDKSLRYANASLVSATGVGQQPTLVTVGGINWQQYVAANTQHQTFRYNNNTTNLTRAQLFGGGGAAPWECVMVLRPDNSAFNLTTTYQNAGIIGDFDGYWGNYLRNDGAGNLVVMAYMWDGSDQRGEYTLAPGTKLVWGQEKAAGSANWNTYVDGVQTTVGTFGDITAGAASILYLGRGYSARYWDGLVGEICIYNRVLTATERASLTNYLIAKWGV